MQSIQPFDAKRRRVRLGDVVRRTMIVDHAGALYTVSMRGKVVDFDASRIVVMGVGPHRWTVEAWDAIDWVVVAHEVFS